MQLDDFVIQIDAPDADGHPMRVLSSPAGEGFGRFNPPGTGTAALKLGAGAARDGGLSAGSAAEGGLRDAQRRAPMAQPPTQTPTQIGTRLFEHLFQGQVGQLFDRSLGGLGDENKGLRLKIKIDPADPRVAPLQSLPWELLYRAETAEFLGLSRRSPVVRYLDVPQPVRRMPLPRPLRVLAVTSSPRDMEPLQLEREMNRIQRAVRGAKGVKVEQLEHATPGRLRHRLLTDSFHVLHFMGHGGHDPATGEGVLFFEDDGGVRSAVSGQALAVKLQDVRSLAMVFLNACHTASTHDRSGAAFSDVAGSLVRGGLPAVVAMRQAISDEAAIAFSSSFYQRLAAGDAVDLALTEGRQAIHSAAPAGFEWSIPILFARVPSGDLFLRPVPRRRAAGWSVGAALALATLGGPWLYQNVVKAHAVFSVDHVFASTQEGVTGRIESVEILADGRMRVYFTFANDTDEAKKIGLDMDHTYLADENGNAYEVLGWSAPIKGAQRMVEAIPPGEQRQHWIEVSAPRTQTHRMGVALAGAERAEVSFPYFEVDLPEYPESLARTQEKRELPPEADVVDLETEVATDVDGLHAAVSQVALVGNQTMRWSLDVLNRAGRGVGLGLVPEGFELLDDLGNVYRPLSHGLWQNPGKFWDGIQLPNALKVAYWLDFPPPRPGASRFTLRLATRKGSEVSFQPAKPDLDDAIARLWRKYPELRQAPQPKVLRPRAQLKPTPPPQPEPALKEPEEEPTPLAKQPIVTFRLEKGEKELKTTLPGLRAKLAAIDRLGNGRMRWHLRFINESGSSLRFAVNYGDTALSAGRLSYRLEQSSRSPDPSQRGVENLAIAVGGETMLWLEFAGQVESVDDLMVLTLASGSPDAYRFRPLMVRMSEVRPSG